MKLVNRLIQIHNFQYDFHDQRVLALAWFLNKYECSECETSWEDEWSCGCDDECPSCGRDFSPYDSDDLSAYTERDKEGRFHIFYSPPEAGHFPEYKLMATVEWKKLAEMLEKIAFELASPE